MKVSNYEPVGKEINTSLGGFLERHYSNKKNYEFFYSEYQSAYEFCIHSKHVSFYPVMATEGNEFLGHIALILDDRLSDVEAFFGFFEVADDFEVFNELWNQLLALARTHNVKKLKGPVNGSIWHQYRCIKEDHGAAYFKTEPTTLPYYYDFLMQVSPTSEVTFSSGLRRSYTDVLKRLHTNEKDFEKLSVHGFKITRQKNIQPAQLLAIAQLSQAAFDSKSWGYTGLDSDEFKNLYTVDKINAHIDHIYLLHKNNKIIGYCSAMREGNTLICKTICITPEFQGIGLGNMLALAIHEDAYNEGVTEIMYVLVRDGNQVYKYPTEDVEIFRRYSAFEYTL